MKQFKYKINGNDYSVTIGDIEGKNAEVEVNGVKYSVEMEEPAKKEVAPVKRPAPVSAPAVAPAARPTSSGVAGAVKSPLPGIILSIDCKVGDNVTKGQRLLVLEAMKMENSINSDRDGKVKEILTAAGASVLEGTDLIIVE